VASQFFSELDNLSDVAQVVTLAATNRIELIDPTLLRADVRFSSRVSHTQTGKNGWQSFSAQQREAFKLRCGPYGTGR